MEPEGVQKFISVHLKAEGCSDSGLADLDSRGLVLVLA